MKGQFCFVEYENPEAATKAVESQREVEGLRVKVKVDLYDGPVESRRGRRRFDERR